MNLPTCWSCQYSFKWIQLLFMTGTKQCPSCGAKQYNTSRKKRKIVWIGPALATLMLVLLNIFHISLMNVLLLGLLLLLIALVISPFTYEFTDKNEGVF
ncbi:MULTISPECIES: TIGR04104 family putative zinc finger protein [Salipaludibacillus]|uniref:TIGR04104 family putative zinc finger protein n=1 Tax=Salipaludibacillus TaxID=1884449 RepID=UPI001602060B|nr:TIGR04104 family putative zinc finger protein [Salipaludibacillus neizhouensis]